MDFQAPTWQDFLEIYFIGYFSKKKTLWNQLFNSQIIAIQTQFHRSMSDKEPAGESVQYTQAKV